MSAASIIDWLAREGRFHRNPDALTEAFVLQCIAANLPLSRVRFALVVLHPQDMSLLLTWRPGQPIEQVRIRATVYPQMLRASPLFPLLSGAGEIRHRLERPQVGGPEILGTLKHEGHTDYFAQALLTQDRKNSRAVVYNTDREGGFTEAHLQILRDVLPVLSLVTEVHAQARRAQTLLETYLGPMTGMRVLQGQIARGDGEVLKAVVWFCDLRGFTALSESEPPQVVLDLLNDFFGVMADVVQSQGGEVLKFMGDAMLAVFLSDGSPKEACQRANAALQQAQTRMSKINADRGTVGAHPIDYGVALHLGEVVYGNIGGETRLDFTVIGPAVNLASRIEAQTQTLDEPVLVSQAFYDVLPDGLERCARVQLKGIAGEQQLYRPRR